MAKFSRFDARNKKKRRDKYRGDKRRAVYEDTPSTRSLWEEVVPSREHNPLRG